MCVMCSTSVPTLFQYFFYDHIPTFLYIFHEMFFITCTMATIQIKGTARSRNVVLTLFLFISRVTDRLYTYE